MNNTAEKIKDAADTFADTATAKAKEGLHAAGKAAVKAGKPKRSPMKVTLFTLLGAAVIGAIVLIWRNQSN
jgi:hypothetical protein